MATIRGRLASKYDSEAEGEVIRWFKAVLNEELVPGMREMEKQLRDGQLLIKLAQHVQKNSPQIPEKARKMTLKANNLSVPFKQMENIQLFLKFCEYYGVKKGARFMSVDLYEGRNMAQVLSCIQQLGSECQRHGFSGATIGPKPQEKSPREFSADKLRAGEGIVGLQAGTNKFATQAGMQIGGVRHCADIRADQMDKGGQSVLCLQSGWNKGDNQSGMRIGSVRHVSDIRADDLDKAGQALIGLQAGSNKFATQAGMTAVGAVRHGSDIRADDQTKESQTILSLQSGSNKFATQAGMTIGGVRHAADIRADDLLKEGQGMVGYQAGWNKGASQAGIVIGGVRHGGDIQVDEMTREGCGMLPYQMGSNKYATQSGMTQIGALRHVSDIRADQMDQSGQGVINLQYGNNDGATQAGMWMGGRRDVNKHKIVQSLVNEL